jgi:hypothetical protein
LYHGLGTAPAADTLPVAAGSDFFFLAAGSATFFFAGCSDGWPNRAARSREAFRSSLSFLRSASLSSPSARGAGRSCTAGNSGGVSERGGTFSGKPPTTAGTLSARWLAQPDSAIEAAKRVPKRRVPKKAADALERAVKPADNRGRAMDCTRDALMQALPARPPKRPALLTQLIGLYDEYSANICLKQGGATGG